MFNGKRNVTETNPSADYAGQVGWSASNTFLGALNVGKIAVNQDNNQGVYSTHAGGAYIAMADGSVALLSESTDSEKLTHMFGRSDGVR